MTDIAADYRGIERMLCDASAGLFRGAGVSPAAVEDALGGTAGLDPEALRSHTRAAVTESHADDMRAGLIGGVFEFVARAAFREILGRLADRAGEWFRNRDESAELADAADAAADALEDVTEVSDAACGEVVLALRAVITQLCAFLGRLDRVEHAEMFSECVGAGADLIDSAGHCIVDTCRQRDTAVAGCLDEFLARGEAVCAPPDPCDAPPVAPAAGGPETTPAPVEPAPPPKKQVAAPTEPAPAPAPVEPAPPPKKQVAAPTEPAPAPVESAAPAPPPPPPVPAAEAPTTPQAVDPPTPVEPEAPAPEPAPDCAEAGEVVGGEFCGMQGLLGIGVLLLGVALVLEALADCEMPAEPAAPAAPEPPEDPAPPAEPAEPVEPPPPPKKIAAPAPAPAPAPMPEPAPEVPESPEAPAATVGARKAGAW